MERNEIWKPIPGFNDSYEASSIGRIRSVDRRSFNGSFLKGKIMCQNTNFKNGYLTVMLAENGKSKAKLSHRMIATAFIDNNEGKKTVNHINGIKTDNRVENLEWASYSENMRHAINTGLATNFINSFRKMDKEMANEARNRLSLGERPMDIARDFNVPKDCIYNLRYNPNWYTDFNEDRSLEQEIISKLKNEKG